MDRFTLEIDDDAVRDLRERLAAAAARRPRPGEGSARRRGEAVGDDLAALDPHRVAAGLNRLPQWTIRIDGARIHFVHVRSERRARGLAGRATGLDRRQGRRVDPRRGPARGAAPPRPAPGRRAALLPHPHGGVGGGRRLRAVREPFRRPHSLRPLGVPTGVLVAAEDISIRRCAEQSNAIVRWTDLDHGGHVAALEQPDDLVADLRGLVDWVRLSAPRRRGTGSTPSARPERSSWVPRAPRCAGRRRP